MNIKKIVQNTSLLLFGLLLCIIALPFYVIYCFGKALCDMDEWQDFTNALWESVSGLHKAKRTVDYLRGLNIKCQHLRHYMDEVQDAVNEADMYNLISEILERYNKEFYKNKE